MVSQLVDKFRTIESLLKDTDIMKLAVLYYREFNKDVIKSPESTLAMLDYLVKHGDSNLALYEFRQKNH